MSEPETSDEIIKILDKKIKKLKSDNFMSWYNIVIGKEVHRGNTVDVYDPITMKHYYYYYIVNLKKLASCFTFDFETNCFSVIKKIDGIDKCMSNITELILSRSFYPKIGRAHV